ncbi:hypothetical protein SUGI_0407150 [Cryptomeria japonica]|nr:hypothetical protein SUGI_0407150 [Cryptomeria japonica]
MAIDSLGRKERFDMKAELTLSPPSLGRQLVLSQPKAEENILKKRKWEQSKPQEHQYLITPGKFRCNNSSRGVDLQMESPLPLDWEQYLDLNSGEIYYMNRRTQEKTRHDPRQKLDLELKISSETTFDHIHGKQQQQQGFRKYLNNEMFAAACEQCHMFVMLSKSSPSCPNCKHVHPLNQSFPPAKDKTVNLFV